MSRKNSFGLEKFFIRILLENMLLRLPKTGLLRRNHETQMDAFGATAGKYTIIGFWLFFYKRIKNSGSDRDF